MKLYQDLSFPIWSAGEFKHSWIGSGVIFEALVAKKPILAFRDDTLYSEDLFPILNAGSPETVQEQLSIAFDPSPLGNWGCRVVSIMMML